MADELPTDLPARMRHEISGEYVDVDDALSDGANEIERLRAERDWLSKELEHMRVSYSSCDAALAQCEQNSQRIAAKRDALRAAQAFLFDGFAVLQDIRLHGGARAAQRADVEIVGAVLDAVARLQRRSDAALAARGKDE